MTVTHSDPAATLVDLAGRIMLTHGLDCRHAMRLLAIDRSEAEDLIQFGRLWSPLGIVRHERLRLFVNILMRLEWRLQHDSRAIRNALDRPLDALSGSTPADLLGGRLEDLRKLRSAIATVDAPTVKWWRVGH